MERIALLTTLVLCSAFAAAESLETPHITVYGTAEVKVTPNEMIWSVNVRNEHKELPIVAGNHTASVKEVLGFLKGLKIDEKKLQTSRMHFGEVRERINGERVRVGFFASTDISFTITDFELYQKIWFGLAAIDGVSIQSTQYAHSDRIRYQNESREKALLAAREKAANLAMTLGSQIAEPLEIQEVAQQSHFSGSNYISNASVDMSLAVSNTSLALGQLSISTKVQVVFKLKNPQQ